MSPLQADSSRPQQVLDTNNKVIETKLNGAAPIKTVDLNNRLYEPVKPEQIAQQTPPNTSEAQQDTSKEGQSDIPKNAEQEARKLFLEAQKAERRAKEKEKQASEGLKKAKAIEEAIELTKSGKDPTALLKAANLDPIKFYQDLTTHALKGEEKPEDPVQKELREHKERLDQYAKDLEEQARTIQSKEEAAMHDKNIVEQVVPLLRDNQDKYESLIKEYGANAALEVYKALWQRYQEKGHTNDDNGVPLTFERVADAMEEYWFNHFESGINEASKMKKFAHRFAQQANAQRQQTPRQPITQPETPSRNFTLSNQHSSAPPAPQQVKKTNAGWIPGETWDERAERIKRQW